MTFIRVKYYNTYVLKKINRVGVPAGYNWFVEESRIKGGYNNVQTGLAPRAFLASEDNAQKPRPSSIIYSSIFNSRTGINQTNVFPSGADITRTVDPHKGSIQKLYAEDTNLTIFQERKVNRALIDKDAIYTQEGQPVQTASNVVIGAIQPYTGDWGISRNPESFAIYGYNKYFTDKDKGAVLRLGNNGITEISAYGMYDYFRDAFANLSDDRVRAGWDIYNKCYTLSLFEKGKFSQGTFTTLSFDEKVNGWTSRYNYLPNQLFSVQNNFYTTYSGAIFQHYSTAVNRATFYNGAQGGSTDSTITTIFNQQPSLVKRFRTINYEGDNNWALNSFITSDNDTVTPVGVNVIPTTLAQMEAQVLQNIFKSKENKYFADLINTSSVNQGEVVYGGQVSGVKGFFATAVFSATNASNTGKNELFAVSTEYNESSY